jgi:hypothetical protein
VRQSPLGAQPSRRIRLNPARRTRKARQPCASKSPRQRQPNEPRRSLPLPRKRL